MCSHRTGIVISILFKESFDPVDPEKCEFPGDEEANRYVDRARREPWVL